MKIVRKEGIQKARIIGHNRKLLYIIFFLLAVLGVVLYFAYFYDYGKQGNEIGGGEISETANPASAYCIENNGALEIRENEAGQQGICKFEDGSECDEWKFFRGECRKGASFSASEETECSSDSDCVKQKISCCECSMGGEEACIPSRNSALLNERLAEECGSREFCSAVYLCRETSCVCINRRCAEKSR